VFKSYHSLELDVTEIDNLARVDNVFYVVVCEGYHLKTLTSIGHSQHAV